ncbi:hypothetical protein KC356_g4599 [Hortaea werneckii]|nr:hypothetical protein KC356_g4599 [Hortaea werneckii]
MSNHPPTHLRTSNNAPTSGSQTITSHASGPSAPPTLRLRAAEETPPQPSPSPSQHVRWAEDVVDNEGMGKKSSKVCCIYHKPHDGAESSGGEDSSSSSSSDSDDSEPDLSRAQRAGGSGKGSGKGKGKGRERKPSPNAYERQPRYGGGGGGKGGKKKEEGQEG